MPQWIKKGKVYDPEQEDNRPFWRWNFAQGQNVLVFDDFIRVYICCREKPDDFGKTVSRVSYVDLSKDNPMEVIRVSEKPVLELGKIGTFDEFGTYPFSVIRVGNHIYGYYGGITRCESVPFNASIGCAISTDNGESFQKVGIGPVLTHSIDEPFVVCSPKVRMFNDQWVMYYSAGKSWTKNENDNRAEICYKLRMALSSDGINWTKLNKNILPDKLGGLESQACGDVIYKNGKYHMFYCYRANNDFRRNKNNSYRIGYAYSHNYIDWIRDDENVGITISENPDDFDNEMVAYPNVFEVNNRIYMLYLGNEVGKHGFGLAELKGELI